MVVFLVMQVVYEVFPHIFGVRVHLWQMMCVYMIVPVLALITAFVAWPPRSFHARCVPVSRLAIIVFVIRCTKLSAE